MRRLLFLLAMTLATFSASAQEMPPLYQSIQGCDEAAVQRLANKDTVNQAITANNKSTTPLTIAVFVAIGGGKDADSMLRIVDTLLDRGAAPNTVLFDGKSHASVVDLMTFLDWAATQDKTHTDEELRSIKMVRAILARLLKHGGVADSKRVAILKQGLAE